MSSTDKPPLDRWRFDEAVDGTLYEGVPRGKLWGLPQIARVLGVSVDTARKWARDPAVPIYQPEGTGQHFAFSSELLAWLKAKKPCPDQ